MPEWTPQNDCCSQPGPCIHNQAVRWRDKIIDVSVARLQRDVINDANLDALCAGDSERQKLLQFFRTATKGT
jgi:hypothetical protein